MHIFLTSKCDSKMQQYCGHVVPHSPVLFQRVALRCIRELKGRKKDDKMTLVCKICKDKSFTAGATLMYHYRSHAGELINFAYIARYPSPLGELTVLYTSQCSWELSLIYKSQLKKKEK